MKAKMLTVAAARARILKAGKRLGQEAVPVEQAQDRTLREAVKAPRPMPPGDASAMDGYAVRAADVKAAPATLEVIGEAPAGAPYPGKVGKDEAVRIFTGGLVPRGADSVVIQENTKRQEGAVIVLKAPARAENIRKKGNDIRKGETLLFPGRALSARDIALAASANRVKLKVARKPKVALIATGDELVHPGARLSAGVIINANTPALAQLLEAEGAEVVSTAMVKDRLGDIRKALKAAAKADLIITIGGASVGDYDYVQDAFRAEGGRLSFWKIAVKPGKPLIFGHLKGKPVIGLPGNPVSAFVTVWLFALPLVRKMLGHNEILPPAVAGRSGTALAANKEREAYLLATLETAKDGAPVVTPFPVQDSSHLKALSRADCLILRKPLAKRARKGAVVTLYPLP